MVAVPALGTTLGTDDPPLVPDTRGRRPRIAVSRTRPPSFVEELATILDAELVPLGSAGYKVAAVIRGEVDAYVHAGGQYEWDSAAPVAVALAAGLHASRIDGSPLIYNAADPLLPDLLVCRPELADPILRVIDSAMALWRATDEPIPAHATADARGRGRSHLPCGGRRAGAPGPAVLRRHGLDRHAAPRGEGVLACAHPVPGAARRHRPQLRRGADLPRPARGRAWFTAHRGERPGRDRPRRGGRTARRHPQPDPDPRSARRPRQAPVHRDLRWGPPRRGQGTGEGTHLLLRDEFGQWDPKNQRPELWNIYNGRIHVGESIRVFPLSNWTELDIWQFIEAEGIALPSIYFAHEREVFDRGGMLYAVHPVCLPREGEITFTARVRYRTGFPRHRSSRARSRASPSTWAK